MPIVSLTRPLDDAEYTAKALGMEFKIQPIDDA